MKNLFYPQNAEDISRRHQEMLQYTSNKGIEDGRRNAPNDSDRYCSFEKVIYHDYQQIQDSNFKKGKIELDFIKENNLKFLDNQISKINKDTLEDEIATTNKENEHELHELELNYQSALRELQNSSYYEEQKKHLDEVTQRWKEVTQKHKREEINIQFKPYWTYLLLLFGIGIAEFPLNMQVFVSFRESPLLTLIMACVLVLSLPFLAHAAGKTLKQAKENKQYPFVFATSLITIILLSYCTSLLRTNYLAEFLNSPEQHQLNLWTFFIIGMVLFFVGTIASYFAHESSNEFYLAHKNYYFQKNAVKELKKELDKKRAVLTKHYQEEKGEIESNFKLKIEDIRKRAESLEKERAETAGKYKKILDEHKGNELTINSQYKESIAAYRHNNISHRHNKKVPISFDSDIGDLQMHFHNSNGEFQI